MKIDMQSLSAPPATYDPAYFSRAFQALETALRRVDFAPVYDPEVQRTDNANPSKALYSTGGIKLDEEFVPESAEDIMPKKYVDAIDVALQEALATLDAARQAAEASLQESVDIAQGSADTAQADVDAVKADASLITYSPAGSVLSSTDVQDALDEVSGDTGADGNVSYVGASGTPLTTPSDIVAALDEAVGNSSSDVTGVIYIKTTKYSGAFTVLEDVINDIDARLTAGAL